jgi:Tfp pilus assembly PilM family ATPase
MPFALPTKSHQRRSPSEVVAVDLATSGAKAVRIRKAKEGLTVMAADFLPATALAAEEGHEPRLVLPKNLLANYAAFTIPGENAVIRILNMPSQTDASQLPLDQIREHVGLGEEYRIGFAVASPARGKQEARVLVVGVPEQEAQAILKMVPIGAPAPFSIEVAGLAALMGFLKGPGAKDAQDAVGVIESGARVTFMALFNRGVLALVRKFDFGAESLLGKVQQQLGVDRETAQGILSDGSFDISQPVHEVMDPFLRQLSISKDFVERREDCRISRFYVSGGASLSRYWMGEICNASGIEVMQWNPFEGLHVAAAAIPEALRGQETRFTAAVGACMGVFSES